MSAHRQPGLMLLALLPALLGIDLFQSRNGATEAGNQRLKAGKAEEALGEYDKAATQLPTEPGAQFNRGTALYALSRFDEAAEAFLRATEAKTPERKAAAFYNLGNSYYQGKKWKEAVAAFRKSLAYDPADARAKWNLELALRKKTEEEKKGENKDDKDKNEKNKEKGKDEQAKDDNKGDDKDKKGKPDQPDKPDDKQQPEQKQEQADKKDDKQQPPSQGQKPQENPGQAQQPPPPNTADGRELEAILDNLEKSPKSLEAELARIRASQRRPPAKDW